MGKVLPPEQICAIIEVCSQNRVKSLAYCGLTIEFHATAADEKKNLFQGDVDQPEGGETPSGASRRVKEQLKVLRSPEEMELLEEARLAQLMTDNPTAYEQEMVDANLYSPRVTNGREENDYGP